MTARGVFYPHDTTTPEERLQHYADVFPLVEGDATYYALPTARQAELWVERTPPDFTFDFKAHALMTGQAPRRNACPRNSATSCRSASAQRPGCMPRISRPR